MPKRAAAPKRSCAPQAGASGTLFGLILIAIEAHLDSGADLATGLRTACERICDLGEVKVGDKSMVDALAPAVAALGSSSLSDAIEAAAKGRDSTETLGRAARALTICGRWRQRAYRSGVRLCRDLFGNTGAGAGRIMKKLFNSAETMVDDMLDGFVSAYPQVKRGGQRSARDHPRLQYQGCR